MTDILDIRTGGCSEYRQVMDSNGLTGIKIWTEKNVFVIHNVLKSTSYRKSQKCAHGPSVYHPAMI